MSREAWRQPFLSFTLIFDVIEQQTWCLQCFETFFFESELLYIQLYYYWRGFAHRTDDDQKSETIVCSWEYNKNYEKFNWNLIFFSYKSCLKCENILFFGRNRIKRIAGRVSKKFENFFECARKFLGLFEYLEESRVYSKPYIAQSTMNDPYWLRMELLYRYDTFFLWNGPTYMLYRVTVLHICYIV